MDACVGLGGLLLVADAKRLTGLLGLRHLETQRAEDGKGFIHRTRPLYAVLKGLSERENSIVSKWWSISMSMDWLVSILLSFVKALR